MPAPWPPNLQYVPPAVLNACVHNEFIFPVPPGYAPKFFGGHFQEQAIGVGYAKWFYSDGRLVLPVMEHALGGDKNKVSLMKNFPSVLPNPLPSVDTFITLRFENNPSTRYCWGEKVGGVAHAVQMQAVWNGYRGDFTWWVFLSEGPAGISDIDTLGNYKEPWLIGQPAPPPDHPAFRQTFPPFPDVEWIEKP